MPMVCCSSGIVADTSRWGEYDVLDRSVLLSSIAIPFWFGLKDKIPPLLR